jgi:hypothetical protein
MEYLLSESTWDKVKTLIDRMDQSTASQNRPANGSRLIALVTCGTLVGTMAGGQKYYNGSNVRWMTANGSFANIMSNAVWLMAPSGGDLIPTSTYLAVSAGPWTPSGGSARLMLIAAYARPHIDDIQDCSYDQKGLVNLNNQYLGRGVKGVESINVGSGGAGFALGYNVGINGANQLGLYAGGFAGFFGGIQTRRIHFDGRRGWGTIDDANGGTVGCLSVWDTTGQSSPWNQSSSVALTVQTTGTGFTPLAVFSRYGLDLDALTSGGGIGGQLRAWRYHVRYGSSTTYPGKSTSSLESDMEDAGLTHDTIGLLFCRGLFVGGTFQLNLNNTGITGTLAADKVAGAKCGSNTITFDEGSR